MLLDLSKILGTLGLVSSLLKPIPVVGDIVPGLVDTVGGLLNSTVGPLLSPTGPVGSLVSDKGPLGGLLGDGGPLGAITGDHGLLSGLLFANDSSAFSNGTVYGNNTNTGNSTIILYCGTDPNSGNSTFVIVSPGQNSSSFSNCTVAYGDDSNDNSTDATSTLSLLLGGLGADNLYAAPIPIYHPNASQCLVQPYNCAAVPLEPFAPFDAAEALVYRYRQQQSVNLGSWFVQEQWMNPTTFACANGTAQSELDVAQGYGGVDNARQVLERHWDEWINETDFKYLASIGINTVRLPIGYWSLGPKYCAGTDFNNVASVYTNSWPRVVRAINWAAKYGLGVLMDLHGAPGSQNGQAHSGVSTGQVNLFANSTSIQQTIGALTFLTQQLVDVNNIVGIELLNEPADDPLLQTFYTEALSVLRAVSPEAESFPFYIHDAFNLDEFAGFVANRTDFVVQDHHSYFVFDPTSNSMTAQALTAEVDSSIDRQLANASSMERRNLVIDEWSCALSAHALNKSSDPDGLRRDFCTSQMQTYANTTAGWAFWSYKTENCSSDPNWCFLGRVGTSLPETFYSYPNSSFSAVNCSAPVGNNTNEFFAFGNAPATLQGLNTPQAASILLAAANAPAGTNNYGAVNEMLSTSAFDNLAAFPPAAPVSPVTNPGRTPVAAMVPHGAGGIVPAAGSNTPNPSAPPGLSALTAAGVPASHAAPLLSGFRKRSAQIPISPPPTTRRHSNHHHHGHPHPRYQNRLQATHLRRQSSSSLVSAVDFSSEQAAIAQGYADGFKAAKSFAVFGGSRLGFTGQFVDDALASSKTISVQDQGFYRTWFLNGLADGEVQVFSAL